MSDDLVERVARGLMPLQGYGPDCPPAVMLPVAAALVRMIRAEALEEAARVVDSMAEDLAREFEPSPSIAWVREKAAAIRAMIGKRAK